MKNKKILFIYDFPLWGNGSATFMRGLARFMLPLGYKIAVTAPDNQTFSKKIKIYTSRPKIIPVFIGHPEIEHDIKYQNLTSQELRRIYNAFARTAIRAVNEYKPDILHINHLMLIAWAGRLASAFAGVRYIITCHGSDLHILEKDRRFFHLTRDALRGASYITVVSADTRQWFTKIFGNEFKSKLRTIPGGIDVSQYSKKVKPKRINKKYHLTDKKVVLYTGRLTPQKGVKYLIKAAPLIKGEIFIIGDGPEKEKLEKLAQKLKTTNVHFLGYFGAAQLKELKEFYWRASVMVAPSVWSEPLGLAALEAMACRTPVVATKKGGLGKIVKNGFNGFLVRSKSHHDLAEKINKIILNPQLRKKMGKQAQKIVKEKYNWKIITKYFDHLYQRIPAPNYFPQPLKKNIK